MDATLAEDELLARLRAGGHRDLFVAVERRQQHLGAERGLRDGDRELGDEIVAVARDRLVCARHERARTDRPMPPPRGPTAPRPVRRRVEPGVDTGRDVDLVRLLGDHSTLAVARRARRDDDLAEAAALRAGTGGDHLTEHALTHPLHLAAAVALRARDRLRPRTGARAAAVVAAQRGANVDGHRRTENGLRERDVGDDFEVLPTGRPGRTPHRHRTGCLPRRRRTRRTGRRTRHHRRTCRRGSGRRRQIPHRPRRSGRTGPADQDR